MAHFNKVKDFMVAFPELYDNYLGSHFKPLKPYTDYLYGPVDKIVQITGRDAP